MTPFHHKMMARLDAATYNGADLDAGARYCLHTAMRRALREANMRGRAIDSADALARAVHAFAPSLVWQVLDAAA